MLSKVRLWPKAQAPSWKENRPASSGQKGATTVDSKPFGNPIPTGQGSNQSSFSSITRQKAEKPNQANSRDSVWAVACLADGKHVVSGGKEGRIRLWRIEDGEEVGLPMQVGSTIRDIAASLDGKWIVSGTKNGLVTVWDADSHEKVTEFNAHTNWVFAVDISPDTTRIATGSEDRTVCVWSLPAGQQLLGPLEHDNTVSAVKFSPDGNLLATATWNRDSLRIYDSYTCDLLVDIPIKVSSLRNRSVTWQNDSGHLFVLSSDSDQSIHHVDAFTGVTKSRWPVHKNSDAQCIVLANDGPFIAVSAYTSLSFWNTMTHERVGSVVRLSHDIWSMATSENNDLVLGGETSITIGSFDDIPDDGREEKVANLHKTIRELRIEFSEYQQKADQERAQEQESSTIQITHLQDTVQQLHAQLAESQDKAGRESGSRLKAEQERIREQESSHIQIASLQDTVQQLRMQLAESQEKANREMESLIRTLRAHEHKHRCETLYAEGRVIEAAESLLDIKNLVGDSANADTFIMNWLADFTSGCVSTLKHVGDEASKAGKPDEALAAYSTVLSLEPSTSRSIVIKWATMMFGHHSVNDVLNFATKFKLPSFLTYQVICDLLVESHRIPEAVMFFRRMQNELAEDMCNERTEWELNFRDRCVKELERLGEAATDSKEYIVAIQHYSIALLLDPTNSVCIHLKRSEARAAICSWEEALADADKAIELDPPSYKGYERRYATLYGMGRHAEAFGAFETMLAKLEQSPDLIMRELRHQYINVTTTIQEVVEQTIRQMPRVLINTTTGNLYDKAQQAAAFEGYPVYNEMRSLMTTRTELDHARICLEVENFYRYVMLSHKWEYGEPLHQRVQNISIYDLESTPPNIKLKTLCTLIRSLGFQWVWSDTCCIDKKDNVVLQESLVAMFMWYRGSSLTLVYLRGVWSHSQKPGDLQKSIWNTRAWTYQEYVAAETVQFYTEDWKPYLDLDLPNHKQSPAIISEMEQASGVSAERLMILRPGLERVREKLSLASMRRTTLVEDVAYSLLGIFNASIPVIYGEGYRAVGRLLEHILTASGDVTILAWTGRAGSYNSCLPLDLTVYRQLVPPHAPAPVEMAEMESMVRALRSSLPDLSLAAILHDHLDQLPIPSVAASRLRLAGIVFPVTELVPASQSDSNPVLHKYRATTAALGDVEIKTTEVLSRMEDLLFIHPWISPLLDQEFPRRTAGPDDTTRALRLVVRLMQPFGALLLAPVSRVQYKRVATDSLIMVRVREETSLNELIGGIRTVDIQ